MRKIPLIIRKTSNKVWSKAFHARSEGNDLLEIARLLGAMRPENDRLARHTWKPTNPS